LVEAYRAADSLGYFSKKLHDNGRAKIIFVGSLRDRPRPPGRPPWFLQNLLDLPQGVRGRKRIKGF